MEPRVCASTRALAHVSRDMRGRRSGVAVLGTVVLVFLAAPSLQAQENLQRFLNALMRGRHGAVIVTNPGTGEIRAVWNSKAVFELAFPPGSAAKLVESVALLEERKISATDRIHCRRVPELLGEPYHCSHPFVASPFDLSLALAHSCNYFFAALSVRLPSPTLAHWYAVLGFGTAVGGWGAGANPGRVRIPEDAAGKARAALGEATVLVTPAQMLLAHSAIATRGRVLRLWTPRRGRRKGGPLLREIELRPQTFDILKAGLEECVRSGTGQGAAVEGVRVAGKTGTAAALTRSGTTHAWFVGYAPVERPDIALVAFLERGTGARDAAPLAGRILRHHFLLKGRKP